MKTAPIPQATFPHAARVADSLGTLILTGLTVWLMGFLVSRILAAPNAIVWTDVVVGLAGCLVLLVSAKRLCQRFILGDALEQRLMAFQGENKPQALTPILDNGASALGWNRLIDELQLGKRDESIDRRVEQAVSSRSNQRFARALRSLPEGIAITDRLGKIQYANPSWVSLLGHAPEPENAMQLIGQEIGELLCARNFRDWDTISETILEGTKPIRHELQQGSTVADGVLQLVRSPLGGRAHENEGYVWTLRDVTQSALASQSHEHFLASAAHELRTPLTNIKAYSESLLEMDGIAPEKQKEFFNVIHSEANRLARLLNQLLDIQQLEAGSMTLNLAAFDVQRMVQEVQEHILPLVNEKQQRLTCRVAPNVAHSIQADKEKVISCLINLLGNAIKYTPAGGEVRLVAEQLETAIAISVEDTGIGMAEEELAKIFDRFYRCHDTRVQEIEGNGLGLTFAKEVAVLHQGELQVESQLNQGSRFTLRLPLTRLN